MTMTMACFGLQGCRDGPKDLRRLALGHALFLSNILHSQRFAAMLLYIPPLTSREYMMHKYSSRVLRRANSEQSGSVGYLCHETSPQPAMGPVPIVILFRTGPAESVVHGALLEAAASPM